MLIVGFGEVAALQQSDPQRVEKSSCDVVGLHQNSASAWRRLLALNEDASLKTSPKRSVAGDRRIQYTRERADPFDNLAMKVPALWFVVTFAAKIERHQHDVFGAKAGVHALGLLQTADEQTRGDQREQRESDLNNHKRLSQT